MRIVKALSIGLLVASMASAAPTGSSLRQGAPAPGFELPSASGKAVKLAEYKGQVVLLNFWATWCGPCRKEMPILDKMHQQYRAKGVTVVGVNVEAETGDVNQYLKNTPVSFPILFDSTSQVSKLYQVQGMPNTVILDRQGKVRYVHRGYKPGVESQYLDQIRALMRE